MEFHLSQEEHRITILINPTEFLRTFNKSIFQENMTLYGQKRLRKSLKPTEDFDIEMTIQIGSQPKVVCRPIKKLSEL